MKSGSGAACSLRHQDCLVQLVRVSQASSGHVGIDCMLFQWMVLHALPGCLLLQAMDVELLLILLLSLLLLLLRPLRAHGHMVLCVPPAGVAV